ncbi:hypothetical protein LguiA_022571 [Lonicera macranthoides]
MAKFEVPLGFRSLPTKKEMFNFLRQKMSGQQFSCAENLIGELNVYDDRQLEEIFSKAEREDAPIYMFTRPKNKGKSINRNKPKKKGKSTNKNKDRTVGSGTWMSQQKGKLVGYGCWRDFQYGNSACRRRHHMWKMTEFFLDEDLYPDRKYNKAKDHEENDCENQVMEQDLWRNQEPISDPSQEAGVLTADDLAADAEYIMKIWMSPMPAELDTVTIPQQHNETTQMAITNTYVDTVPALMEEPLLIATTNIDTNVVAALMEEPLQIPIPSTYTDTVGESMDEPMQIASPHTNTYTLPGSVE